MVSVAANSTATPHASAGASTVIVAGTAINGAVPTTVTVNCLVIELLYASLAVTTTVVVPIGKTEPLAGVAVELTSPEQLSNADGLLNVNTAPFALVANKVTFAINVGNVGGVTSLTIILNVFVEVPKGLVAVAVTVVVPTGKVDPG